MKPHMKKVTEQIKRAIKVSAFVFCCLCFIAGKASAQEITAIDFNGDLLGKVIPDGNVVGFDNSLIGNVTADSLIVNFDGELIGGVVPQGVAVANDNSLLGKVNSDGTVRQPSGKVVGKVLPNGLVVNDYYDILGAVLFPGLVYDDDGKTVGRLTGDGLYTNLKGQAIGFVSPDGYAYRRVGEDYILEGRLISSKMVIGLDGSFLGSIVPGGEVSDFNGNIIGRIKANGFVYAENNEIIGRVVKSGYAFDEYGRYLGYVTYNGEVVDKGNKQGKLLANGSIANVDGNIIGFAVDVSATATSLDGRYLGRIVPGGNIARAKDVSGIVAARGNIISSEGKIVGSIMSSGPVFDFRASLIGHAANNGQLISLTGNAIGKMIGNRAYDTQGQVLGAISKPSLIVGADNKIFGISGINSRASDDNDTRLVSPFGYTFTTEGNFAGMSIAFSPVYNQIGAQIANIGINGKVKDRGNSELGKLTQSGIIVDERNIVLGRNINDEYAVNNKGNSFGILAQNNLIIDNNKSIVAKITPDFAVIKTDTANNSEVMPKAGSASDNRIAVDFLGALIGYVNSSGQVLGVEGVHAGHVIDDGYVIDNNNIVIGVVIAERLVVDNNCNVAGMITPRGEARNIKNIYIGRVLANGQVVDEAGNVVAHTINPSIAIDYNGNTVATVSGDGRLINYNGEVLGCLNSQKQVKDNNNSIVYGSLEYMPVINFEDNLVGRVSFDGQVIGADNQILGYMQPDGNINNRTGVPLGNIFKYKIAFNNDNRYLGHVLEDGRVQNEKGEELGKVNFDGTVVRGTAKIGYALYDFYVYNDEFLAVGLIDKNGTVHDFNNKNIGNLQRGFVVGGDDKLIARGNRDFYIRDDSNIIIGELMLNGDVLGRAGNLVGKLEKNGDILDASGNKIAVARPLQYYSRLSSSPSKQIVIDAKGKIVGYVDESGNVTNSQGDVIATRDAEGNLVDNNGNVVGRVVDPKIVYDDKGKIVGRIQKDGRVINSKGEVVGKKNKDGRIVNERGQVIGKTFDVDKVYDEKGNIVGYVQPDGSVVDANGKEVGQLNEDGTVTNANNNIIGGIGNDWYERIDTSLTKRPSLDDPIIGTLGEKRDKPTDSKYRKSLNIALSPDGTYIGDIMEDGSVVDKQGRIIGQKTPDGLIIDDNGTLVGIEEIKKPEGGEIFVPAGTFGKGAAYGTGVGPGDNLGPGGGFGPGERYNAQRSAALAVAQGERRQNMQVGKISSNIRKEAFDGMQKDWSEQGIDKSISSWRVDMSRMILADKPIPAVLARSIDSNNPTPVTAIVERNVYAEEGRNIIIPAGSRLMGEFGGLSASSESTSETGKVSISWIRLIRPDGSMFKFDGLTADVQGRGGALGYVDQQLFKRYAFPVMTTILTSTMAYVMATDEETSGETESSKQEAANDARDNFLDQMNQMFEQILNDKADIRPVTYVPAGTRMIVFPKVDLWLRDIENDKEENSGLNNPTVLINDEERLKRDSGDGSSVAGTVDVSSGGQVSYDEDTGGEKPKSVPLISDKARNEKTKQPVVVPPPPPSSSSNSSGKSYSPPKSKNTSSGGGASNSDQSVPQLF